MVARIPELERPEIFIGFVAPIGVDVNACVQEFRKSITALGYRVIEIKITDVFENLAKYIPPERKLEKRVQYERYVSHIEYGNLLRKELNDDAFLAALAIGRIVRARRLIEKSSGEALFHGVCYLLYQFKRREEIALLRSVYGQLFFQVSIYSRRGARVDYLAHRFANSDNSGNINPYRANAEELIQRDENEIGADHGQKVQKIFSDGDFILNMDHPKPPIGQQVDRICNLMFGSNSISPSKMEYGMFLAKAAALRTLDLSRQVGAAIFSAAGEIISIGANEVPKGSGGTYWCDEDFDDREFVRNEDSNDRRKKEVFSEVLKILGKDPDEVLKDSLIKESQFMDALEYGRIVHAEMSAISDAARLGRAVQGSTLFCTTFPCHMCAKHIVASGVSKVVFLEPYPKSLVLDLHSDSISIERGDRGKFQNYPSVEFEHFSGISPRRYRELFERFDKRKTDDGKFKKFVKSRPQPSFNIGYIFYTRFEKQIVDTFIGGYIKAKGMNWSILTAEVMNYPPSTATNSPSVLGSPARSKTTEGSARKRRHSEAGDDPLSTRPRKRTRKGSGRKRGGAGPRPSGAGG